MIMATRMMTIPILLLCRFMCGSVSILQVVYRSCPLYYYAASNMRRGSVWKIFPAEIVANFIQLAGHFWGGF